MQAQAEAVLLRLSEYEGAQQVRGGLGAAQASGVGHC